MREIFRRWMPLLVASGLAAILQWRLMRWVEAHRPNWPARGLFAVGIVWLGLGVLVTINRLAILIPPWAGTWMHATALLLIALTVVVYLRIQLPIPETVAPGRRQAFTWLANAAVCAPFAAIGYGTFVERSRLQLQEVDLPVTGLPKGLNGLRMGQITDIHLGPFLERRELDRAVALLNEGKPSLALVTGDLISRRGDPLDDCIDALRFLKAEAGVYGCLGNHERYARAERYTQEQCAMRGIRILRNRTEELRFDGAVLALSGVDYQATRVPYLRRGEHLIRKDAYNVLLSHNPDVFEKAAALGFDLTVAGHTHGGQVNVEILEEHWNVARFYTRYVSGLYHLGSKSIYVSRGVGTIGLPLRLGAPPEVTVFCLRAV